jgi:hypothetical protein
MNVIPVVDWSADFAEEERRLGLSLGGAAVVELEGCEIMGGGSECGREEGSAEIVFVLFEKMRRLKASTPLSVAGVRGMLEEEEEDAVLEVTRKGLRVVMLGGAEAVAGLGIGAVDGGSCSAVVVLVVLFEAIRSGTRAITSQRHVTRQPGQHTLHKDHVSLDTALALPMPDQSNHGIHLAILHTLALVPPHHAIANLPISPHAGESYLLCDSVIDGVEGREKGDDGVEGRQLVEAVARGMVQLEQKGAERAVLGRRQRRRRQRRVAVVVQSICARHRNSADGGPSTDKRGVRI